MLRSHSSKAFHKVKYAIISSILIYIVYSKITHELTRNNKIINQSIIKHVAFSNLQFIESGPILIRSIYGCINRYKGESSLLLEIVYYNLKESKLFVNGRMIHGFWRTDLKSSCQA